MHTRNFYHCFFFLHSVCLLRSLRTSTRMTSTRTYCRNLTTQQRSCHLQSLEPQKPLYRYMFVFFSLTLSPHLIYFVFCCHHLFTSVSLSLSPLFFSQVLRSVDRWSAGTCEHSILNAYVHVIENSQHYIYLEVTLSL